MQQVLQDLPLTLAYIGSDLVAIALLVGATASLRPARRAAAMMPIIALAAD